MEPISSSPTNGNREIRYVGDRFRCSVSAGASATPARGWTAKLRTNIGRGKALRHEIIQAATSRIPPFGACWHDLAMIWSGDQWTVDVPLAEVGFYTGKPYLIDPAGYQHWPHGPDFGVSVHPDWCRSGNTVYCAFTRLMGETRHQVTIHPEKVLPHAQALRETGAAVLPVSGTFRDLQRQLPHIVDRLGCRIIQLLPIHPTPTVFARFGPMGSPYAALDLTGIDPALVEFDHRTTGVQQFCELSSAIHQRGARLFLDIVVNHTGWGSRLFEEHPEFFRREPDGRFACPGAWGVVWEDLVELDQQHLPLWNLVAESLLTWCRRGVDGFRCDAGYKIPVHVWQYITARVHEEFPETVFLLEGLGGSWDATEQLLTQGGMQWAYSELFQNYSGGEVQAYLDYAFDQSRRVGTYVHFSETHDNERLAARGRAWSTLRNRLCALTSVSGGFGFTSGVEWLAPEKIRVHERTGLAWDQPDNLVEELATLNRVISEHPTFFAGATLRRLSPSGAAGYALLRTSPDGSARTLVLANTNITGATPVTLVDEDLGKPEDWKSELLGQPLPPFARAHGRSTVVLEPAQVLCLSTHPTGREGTAFRRASSLRAWAIQCAAALVPAETVRESDAGSTLAELVAASPENYLAALSEAATRRAAGAAADLSLDTVAQVARSGSAFPNVVRWTVRDISRVTLVPPGWWVFIRHDHAFRAHLTTAEGAAIDHIIAIPGDNGWFACIPPRSGPGSTRAQLHVDAFHREPAAPTRGELLFLGTQDPKGATPDPEGLVLLTNGRGGMARLRRNFGSVASKYDAALAANLDPALPVDRHVFVKRVRAWLNADGFISALEGHNLTGLVTRPPARWSFRVNAGDGRTVRIDATANMVASRNTTLIRFSRSPEDDPLRASLVLRVDLEDRNFHSETQRNPGSDHHFQSHVGPLPGQTGFLFAPSADRRLAAKIDRGTYHPQAEWSEGIGHPNEASRGQVSHGDAFSPGWFEVSLAPGQSVTLALDAESQDLPFADPAVETSLTPPASKKAPSGDADLVRRLHDASAHYVVRRDHGMTVIAGYPWFLDWGRDTFIAARGLLRGGWHSEVVGILEVFAPFAERGTLPNSIHGSNAANRDTSDAPLWFGVLLEETAEVLGEAVLHRKPPGSSRSLFETARELALGYIAGTPNGISVDPVTGLVWSPAHFTWMDTNHPAGTPRRGYPVEIQALWLRVLRFLARLDRSSNPPWNPLLKRAEEAIPRLFWIEELGWFADVLHAEPGTAASSGVRDNALRPNALFLVALGIVTGDRARRLVRSCLEHLVVPGALRSLAPLPVSPPLEIRGHDGRMLNDPSNPYWGRYKGDEDTRRKPAYHNGTAWCWLLPTFCEALAIAWDHQPEARAAARAILGSCSTLLDAGCADQLPEILDGDAPHRQRGCDAQAWSVTEALRVAVNLGKRGS